MKKLILFLCTAFSVTANAQYFQRYFYSVPQHNETFADGLCTVVNYGATSSASYNIGWGTSYFTFAADTNDEVRFVKTNKNGTTVNVNNAGSFRDNVATGLWLNSRGNGICEIFRTGNAGGYIGVGSVSNNTTTGAAVPGSSDGLFTKVNNSGVYSSSYRYDFTAGKDVFTAIKRSSLDTNRFYICGYSEKTAYTEVIVMAVRANGAIIWSNLYHLAAANYSTVVRAFGLDEIPSSGKVVVVGSFFDATDPVLTDGFVLMLNSSGTVNWVSRHNLGTSTDVYRNVIQTQTPNRIAICGYSNYNTGAAPYNDVWLTCIDTIGNVITSFKYRHRNAAGTFFESKGYDLCEVNTVVWVTGPVYSSADTTLGIYRLNFLGPSAADEPMQYRSQKYDNAYGIDRLYSAGAWLIRGFTGIDDVLTPGRSSSYMVGTNFLGNTCNYCFVNPNFNLNAPINKPAVTVTKLTAGTKVQLTYRRRNCNDSTICKSTTACSLRMQSGYENDNVNNNDIITISPNPANDFLNLSLQKDVNTNVDIIITDITGRRLIDKTVNSSELVNYQLDISKLKSGVYLIHLNTDTQSIIKQFIKN